MGLLDFIKSNDRANTVLVICARDKEKALAGFTARVLFADDCEEALEILKDIDVDVVVARWSINGHPDGDILIKVRSAIPSLPLIAIVDSMDNGCERAARASGMTAVITEEIHAHQLRYKLTHLINRAG
ncbi:hypothetical protein STSP2_01482 [Anaerohalosphaera lusitana]|uniref:Response regulatory domain-containing protein n=1 Tax=Anaerohalosphaera lusitana TaxID=1936003 RepID=A0A1U9NK58_9BACT|nr:hypothetical protein [Anaerohalosphaera lusitana]AQT68323.1 hypothetical protein STSP2_01482 [Anaerohalosphaera lusitana]